MSNEKIHSINQMYWQKGKGKGNSEQYRLRGKASGNKTIFGHKAESQAGIIDNLLLQGRFTLNEMAISSKFKGGKIAVSRVRQHLYQKLVKKLHIDVAIDDKGRVFAANVKESNDNHNLLLHNEVAKAEQAKAEQAKHVRRQAAIKGLIKKQKKA
jgi:hypothetical protein